MMNDEPDTMPDAEMENGEETIPVAPPTETDDDLRYAPPAIVEPVGVTESPPAEEDRFSLTDQDEDEESGYPYISYRPDSSDLDVDAALAAVASLSDMVAEQEATEQARLDAALVRERLFEQSFPMPPFITLRRGQMASVVPALLLIGIGAWLTFALTTSDTLPASNIVLAVVLGAALLTLLVQWLSSGRWSRGAFFFLALAVLTAATVAVLLFVPGLGLIRGWPLLSFALAATLLVASRLSRPRLQGVLFPTILLVLAGLIGLTVTTGLMPATVLGIASAIWPAVAVVLLLVWLLPALARKRS